MESGVHLPIMLWETFYLLVMILLLHPKNMLLLELRIVRHFPVLIPVLIRPNESGSDSSSNSASITFFSKYIRHLEAFAFELFIFRIKVTRLITLSYIRLNYIF